MERFWPLCLVLVLCSRALPQSLAVGYDLTGNSADFHSTIVAQPPIAPLSTGSDRQSSQQDVSASGSPEPYGWKWAIYPAFLWAPVFGSGVAIPPGPSESTGLSLDAAYFGGVRFEKGKWSADALFAWASLSAQRETPFAKVNLDLVRGDALAGRQLFNGLYAEAGVRRLSMDVDAAVESSSASRSLGYWDPVIGVTYRRQLGRK